MEAKSNLAELLQWYSEVGVDEVIGEEPVDRTKAPAHIPEKSTVLQMPIAAAVSTSEPPKPIVGTIEALGEAKAVAERAETIEELKTALENFKGLALKRTATQMVFADGQPTARVMIVGDVPGADEDRAGRPYAGEQGQLLDKMLAAIGLGRENSVYITTIVNWRPPGNRPPSESELALSLPFVQRHIELVNPAVLLFFGGGVAKALLQSPQNILKLRGKWLEYSSAGLQNPVPTLAMLTPAYLLESPAQKSLAWADLLMLKEKLQGLKIL